MIKYKKPFLPKIVKNTLNPNLKTVELKPTIGHIGTMKYFPSFSKEWKNIIYSYNKNNIKNIPTNDNSINKILQSYFNLYFTKPLEFSKSINVRLREKRTFLRRIFVSNAEIKHTSNKVKITLYASNREKNVLKKKYVKLLKKMNLDILKRYTFLYKNYILNLYSHLNNKYKIRDEYVYSYTTIPYLKHKLNYLSIFLLLNNLLLKKIWSYVIKNQSKSFTKLLSKYNSLYSLNQFKFNKLKFLPKLSYILRKIIGKKIHYNIINLKSISYNADLFTKILALKIKTLKFSHIDSMLTVLNKGRIPEVNPVQERSKILTEDNLDQFLNKYNNLNVISNIKKNFSITSLFKNYFEEKYNSNNNIHNTIYNSIKYKNMHGIQIVAKGRLTKRYRADRAIVSLKRKGGLKNIDSSYKGLSSILFRGNTKSNTSYSFSKSKRRIGAFAVKGWISGK